MGRALAIAVCGIAASACFSFAPPAVCGPGTCSGCCSSGVCDSSGDDSACGSGGLACSDCTAAGQTCSAGACQSACVASGAACSTSGECCSGLSCSASGRCESSTCTSNCPPDYQDTGSSCARNSDCSSGSCLPLGNGENACTLGCSGDGECVPGWQCRSFTGVTGSLCQCARGAEVCNGKDDDCNGRVDDSQYEVDRACKALDGGAGTTCQAGACTCTMPFIDCAGKCVDSRTGSWSACGGACVDLSTSKANCGACGSTCSTTDPRSTASCLEGTCRVVTDIGLSYLGVLDVTFDATRVYWAGKPDSNGVGSILTCPLGGCGSSADTPPRVRTGLDNPTGVFVTGTTLLWSDTTPVMKCTLPNCSGATPVYSVTSVDIWGTDVVADSSTVVFATVERAANSGKVMSCPLSGCGAAPTVLASGLTVANKLKLAGGFVYWAEGSTVKRCALTGCNNQPATVATDPNTIYSFDVDATTVYWASFQDGVVHTCPVSGCTGAPGTLAGTQWVESGMHVDDTHAYWCSNNQVERCAKTGCTRPTVVGSVTRNCLYLYGNGGFVYLSAEGRVYRVNK